MCTCVRFTISHANTDTYTCSFLQTWKTVDERRLTGRITHALRGLEEAHDSVIEDMGPDNSMTRALKDQIKRLEDKLLQIAGEREVKKHRENMDQLRTLRGLGVAGATVGRGSAMRSIEGGTTSVGNTVGGMSNEQLAHELLLDTNFRLCEEVSKS